MHNNIAIVVNTGSFRDAYAGANAEKIVDWWDESSRDAAACTECFAAVELRKHLCILTCADENDARMFPILSDNENPSGTVFYIGNKKTNRYVADLWEKELGSVKGKLESLPESAFLIKSIKRGENDICVLAGKDRTGTLYAVYSFLESLGFRWFGLGAKGMHFKPASRFEMPSLDYFDYPKFKTRGAYSEMIDDTNPELIDWLTRNRVNFAMFGEITNPHNLKKRGIKICRGGHDMMHRFLNPKSEYPYSHPVFGGDGKPADSYGLSDSYAGDINGDGKLSYSEAHPEWYCYVDGKRSFDIGEGPREGFGDNYCTSNEEATEELSKNIVESLISGYLDKADYINAWMLDNGKWCTCDRCNESGNYSYRVAMVVYRLRKKMEEEMKRGRIKRNVKILFPAYHETLPVPDKPLPEDFDYENCIVSYFVIERCYIHNINDTACTETNQELMETYTKWTSGENYKGEMLLGEYYNVSSFAGIPVPVMSRMKHDIPFYYKTGVRHLYYMHITGKAWGTLALTNYQLQKMLWNPAIDVEILIDDYFASYYGELAQYMREFYESLETAMANAKYFKHYLYHKRIAHRLASKLNNDDPNIFPLKHMQYDEVLDDSNAGISMVGTVEGIQKCRILIDRILMKVVDEPVLARVLEAEMRFSYGEDIVYFIYYLMRTNLLKWKGLNVQARRAFKHARYYAGKLEGNTEALVKARQYNYFDNGLKASWCEKAYLNYLNMFG